MSLTVKHLNGDSTFLLTFSPSESSQAEDAPFVKPNTFSVLVDPWLEGDSVIFHPKFALAKHIVPACIKHLSEIPTPDVVVISQGQSDHCHKDTLTQLDASLEHTIILAHPAAGKTIRGWKYFNPAKVIDFTPFIDKKPETVIRFRIPCASYASMPGEATLAFMPAKRDITGLHNAIGITYRPPTPFSPMTPMMSPLSPTFSTTGAKISTFNLPLQGAPYIETLPPTPPESPNAPIGLFPDFIMSPPPTVHEFSRKHAHSLSQDPSKLGPRLIPTLGHNRNASTPNLRHASMDSQAESTLSPSATHSRGSSVNFSRPISHTRKESIHPPSSLLSQSPFSPSNTIFSMPSTICLPTTPTYTPCRQKTLSIIYSPHGVSYSAVRAYATSHLISQAALPLTLLLHAFNRVQNTWYFGGNIIAGVPGGLAIAHGLAAKTWISAHDEENVSSGFSVLKIVKSKWGPKEVENLLIEKAGKKSNKAKTDVKQLGVGESCVLTA